MKKWGIEYNCFPREFSIYLSIRYLLYSVIHFVEIEPSMDEVEVIRAVK